MKVIFKVLKPVAAIIVTFILVLGMGLYYLNKNPISIPGKLIQRLALQYTDLTLRTQDVKLSFIDYKFQVKTSHLEIINKANNNLQLKDAYFSILLKDFSSEFLSKIDKTDISHLLYFIADEGYEKDVDEFISKKRIYFDGEINLSFKSLNLNKANIKLVSRDGWYSPEDNKEDKIKLEECKLLLSYQDEIISIDDFTIKYLDNFDASFKGDFFLDDLRLSSANFEAQINNLAVEYLADFWPKLLFPEIQTWVTSRITKGNIKQARGKFNFSKEDLLDDALISKNSMEAEIDVNNAKLNYLEGYTPIDNIEGKVKFDGESLYVNAISASIMDNILSDLELVLPFNNFILSLKAKALGEIKNFSEFFPKKLHETFLKKGIDFDIIKGKIDGVLDLSIPIFEDFKLESTRINIQADITDFFLKKLNIIDFKNGKLSIVNTEENISVKVENSKGFLFDFIDYHDFELKHQDILNFKSSIRVRNKISLGNKLSINKGIIKVSGNLSIEKWKLDLNFYNSEVDFIALGSVKPIKESLILSCVGKYNDNEVIGDNCSISGDDFSGDALFSYSIDREELSDLSIKNAKIYKSYFDIDTTHKDNFHKLNINANVLDLSHLSTKNLASNDTKKNHYDFSFNIEKLILKNEIILKNLNASIKEIGHNIPDVNLKVFSDDKDLSIIKIRKNSKDGYLIYSESASTFSKALNLYQDIKGGTVSIEIYPELKKRKKEYNGKIKLENFAFSSTSSLTKVILGVISPFNSPRALFDSLKGGSLKADSFIADFNYKEGILLIENGSIKGNSYEIKINGSIDTNKSLIDFKGMYVPSVYGINSLVSFIPVFGKLISGGKNSAFIAAKFSIKGDLENPKTFFNPFSVFALGFTKHAF